jgi:Tfp pilus assembly protein PilO
MLIRDKQQITICLIAVVTIGGFIIFRYLTLKNKIQAVEQTISAQRLTIAKGVSDREQLPLFEEQLKKLQSELEDYEANIPEKRDLGLFLSRIADLMNQYELREQIIESREEIKGENFSCIPLNIRCKGSLTQMFEFYQRLQGLDRLIRIEQVKFLNDGSFGGDVSMQTRAVIYYRAEVEQG